MEKKLRNNKLFQIIVLLPFSAFVLYFRARNSYSAVYFTMFIWAPTWVRALFHFLLHFSFRSEQSVLSASFSAGYACLRRFIAMWQYQFHTPSGEKSGGGDETREQKELKRIPNVLNAFFRYWITAHSCVMRTWWWNIPWIVMWVIIKAVWALFGFYFVQHICIYTTLHISRYDMPD